MTKILAVLLGLFILFDIGLAFILFNPTLKISSILGLLPKNCKVVDSEYCKTATIVGNEKLNETVAALFSLPKGTRVYSPVNGELNFSTTTGPEKVTYHTIKDVTGITYVLVFEPESVPQSRQIRAGDVIGTTTGRKYTFMQNNTLGVSTLKDQRFAKAQFDSLFR